MLPVGQPRRGPRSSRTGGGTPDAGRKPAVESHTLDRDEHQIACELLLFLEDGWPACIELVHYAESTVGGSPPLDQFAPPTASR